MCFSMPPCMAVAYLAAELEKEDSPEKYQDMNMGWVRGCAYSAIGSVGAAWAWLPFAPSLAEAHEVVQLWDLGTFSGGRVMLE